MSFGLFENSSIRNRFFSSLVSIIHGLYIFSELVEYLVTLNVLRGGICCGI